VKYFAILKDSIREARDSWVLFGLLCLSTLVILFVASLSFQPVSAERAMRLFFAPNQFKAPEMYEALNNRKAEKVLLMQGRWRPLELENVEVIRGEADSPQSDYALTVRAIPMILFDPMMRKKEAMRKKDDGPLVEKQPNPEADRAADLAQLRMLFEDAEEAGYIKIGAIEAIAINADGNDLQRYRVTLSGTSGTHRIWATETSFLFGAVPLNWILSDTPLAFRLYKVAKLFISFGSWVAVLLGIIVTAFFIPNMLRKGTVDLLLVKPISRGLLLLYKYLGGLSFMFLITAYAIGGIWLALGLRSGFWANGALLLIFSLTFFFAILYAVSTLVGVVTRSVVMSILVTVFVYTILASIGTLHGIADAFERLEQEVLKRKDFGKHELLPEAEKPAWLASAITSIKVLYAISPRTDDLNDLNDLIVYSDFMTGSIGNMEKVDNRDRNWWLSFAVSTIWIAIFLGLAMLWFYYKDY
jgi:ABC-type transport system involved in multi-copper enzyme maturation permease subunit